MAARTSAIEREVLTKVMAWFEAQRRGFAVEEADAVLAACERLERARGGRRPRSREEVDVELA